jgi:site-specific DNA recombinase
MIKPVVRCAVYSRKSTEEGLEQQFNSLDAQREGCEAYIRSQAALGWECLSTRYDDGGFSGANTDRPALRRLMADIESGKVDCVVVYKVDRLSRSLLDFGRMMEVFEKYNVTFVSTTQQIDTNTSMGRLMLNVLLSFAQFEREMISERTRDKMAAARRKGKRLGGKPVLGYAVDSTTKQLVVSDTEAAQIKAIFGLYLDHQAILPVVHELARRGWVNKRWTNKRGEQSGGQPFNKTSIHYLLTNVTYVGKVRYKTEIHDGEHDAIIDAATWQKVQRLLQRNGRTGGAAVRNKYGALLKGLLFCKPCGCAMSPTHSTKGNKRYRYYLCLHAQKIGWDSCPSKSIPAGEIERFVIDQIRHVAHNPDLVRETLQQINAQQQSQVASLESELMILGRDLAHWNRELFEVSQATTSPHATARLADLQERITGAERRMNEVRDQLAVANSTHIDETEVTEALAKFDDVWNILSPREQTRIVELLIERIDYDGGTGNIAIKFRQDAVPLLAKDITTRLEVA